MRAGQPVVLIGGFDLRTYTAGGHLSYVEAHARAAQAAGYSPQIFCLAPRSEVERVEFGTIHRVGTRFRHYLVGPSYQRPIATAIGDYLEHCGAEPPHVIHAFGTWGASAVSASALLARRGIASVPITSSYDTARHEWEAVLRGLGRSRSRAALYYRAWYPWIRAVTTRTERRGLRRARLVLVNYESVAALLRASHGPDLAIRQVPYAAPSAFRPTPSEPDREPLLPPMALPAIRALQPDDAPLIVTVSRHTPRKGLEGLLRALAALRSEGVAYRACLVGPGRQLERHRRLASELGLDGRVAIPGRVDDVLPHLQAADVFVLPSLQEGSGSLALLEALQAGTAVVASRIDGIPEDIDDGDTGLLVPPGDDRALADALRRLLADPGLRDRLGARARALYLDRFTAARFSAAIGSLYDELRDGDDAK